MFACIVLQSLQSFCNLPNYPQELLEEDSALLLSMNNKGLQQYVQCAIQQSSQQFLNTSLPGLTFNMSVDGILLLADFKNISLVEINTNKTVVDIKTKSFEAHNTNIIFNFSWTLQQMTYPYITDNGYGFINITGSDLYVYGLDFYQDLTCKGNLNCGFSNVFLNTNNLNISLFGIESYIFEVLEIQLINELNKQLLNSISDFVGDIVQEYTNILDDNQYNYQWYPKYPNIVKDDRFTSNMMVELNQLVFMKSGYTFSITNMSDQYIQQQMINALPVTKNNKQVEYTISKAALDNFLYIFHTYNNSYSNPSLFSVVEAPTMELSKNLVTLNLKVKIQDEEADLKLKGVPKLRTENDLTYLFFEFELEPEYYEVISWVNEQIKDACYLIKNEVFSLNGFSVVIDTDNDCVKIVGDIAACL
ncbi:BPI-like_protein [Hexamita inflata]|uniref:BPI-like protein n=1 Tax=Hexamita inflata TaxID=28002 RepID=A0AA86P803_9EUKA|nr:BPI-like protein [Hexamita inflata]